MNDDFYVPSFVFVFNKEILITVTQQAPDKEAWPSPYHYRS
jgi:hypothetical protein